MSDSMDRPIGITGTVVIGAYVVVLSVVLLYILVKIWPHPISTGSPSPQSQVTNAVAHTPSAGITTKDLAETFRAPEDPAPTSSTDPLQISLFGGLWKAWPSDEIRLLVIVVLAGAFGSLLHSIRSLYWYVGNRDLKWSWALMYILLPFGGGILAMLFYFVVRGGFFSPQATTVATNPFAFGGVAGLVGMFSSQAVEKLKQVAGTVFAPAEQGKDHVAALVLPKINSVSPQAGPALGGTPITINGSNFATGAKASIDGQPLPATAVTPTSITATTPAHSEGKVDIEVTNPDNNKASFPNAFTYT